jgi:hypothetical protein
VLLAAILCCLLFPMALGPQWHWSWPLKVLLAHYSAGLADGAECAQKSVRMPIR